jgi:HK97 family phage prohead protease
MSDTQRRYLSKNGLRELMRSVADPKLIDTKNLCVLVPMPAQVKAVGSENSRLIEFIVSTGRVDRENDTIEPSGWDLTDYKSNPVVLWVHDHWSPPIGNARSTYLDGDALKSMCEFTPEDLNPFGYQIYKLYAGGFMHACSAGFQPIEYAYDEMRKYGINFKKQSLLEYSCVPVPANPDALAIARSKGLKTDLLKAWAERALDEHPTTDDARRQLEVLRNLSTPDGRALIIEIGGMKMSGPATDPPAPPPTPEKTAPPTESVITKVERWTCAEKHEHTTEQEAKDCGNIAAIIASSVTSVKALTMLLVGEQAKAVEKAGRVLSAANEERLRSALSDMTTCTTRITEVLSQLPAEDEDDEEEDDDKDATGVLMVTQAAPEDRQDKDDDGEGVLITFPDGVDPAAVMTAAVKEAVTAEINRLTGRVD